MTELPDERIALRLKTPWSDGTTHVVYEPVDLIASSQRSFLDRIRTSLRVARASRAL